jgi:cell division protein FtsA
VFDLPVRLGAPAGLTGIQESSASPQHATAVGLAFYSARNLGSDRGHRGIALGPGALVKFGSRVRTWFAEMF